MDILAQVATECVSDATIIGTAITNVALIAAGTIVAVYLIKTLL